MRLATQRNGDGRAKPFRYRELDGQPVPEPLPSGAPRQPVANFLAERLDDLASAALRPQLQPFVVGVFCLHADRLRCVGLELRLRRGGLGLWQAEDRGLLITLQRHFARGDRTQSLFPTDERSCCLYLSCDDQHGVFDLLLKLGNLYLLLRAQLLPLHRSSICHNELVASG